MVIFIDISFIFVSKIVPLHKIGDLAQTGGAVLEAIYAYLNKKSM
ncbi:MAG: hypothetical protein PHW73_08075 [Atribacterota bacterium]|nr:hypothetical protein [Atribacterota bacterium]